MNGTNINQEISKLAYDLLGDEGLLGPVERRGGPREAPVRHQAWVTQFMASLGGAIAGGTANIQRNIIAERGLGLPRDYWAASRTRGS